MVLLARALYLRAEKTDRHSSRGEKEREFLAEEEEFSRERRDERRDEEERNVLCWRCRLRRVT